MRARAGPRVPREPDSSWALRSDSGSDQAARVILDQCV